MKVKRGPYKLFPHAGLLILFVVLVILSVFFHQPIKIVDALTSEAVPGFGIHISAWRLLFEPFFGPLLYYLRADQAVLEFAVLLLWILVLFLLFSLKGKMKGILGFLKTTPLIIVIWLGLLWLLIYIPLPANTILKQQEHSVLINTHSHTEYSHDGIISTGALQRWHKKNGFDAFFITDHNHHQKTLEAVRAQEQGLFQEEPLIMAGEEYSGSNHMTLLGLSHNFVTRGLSDQEVIDTTHADKGVVLVAHWFDGERKSIPYFLDMGVDGFEIANQAYGLSYDRRVFKAITEACSSNDLIMNGAADYHGYGSSCFVWNSLEIPNWHQMDPSLKRESIMQVLRERDMSRIQVLLYHDRVPFDRSRVLLSPLFNAVNYGRTLNLFQLLSWFFWLLLLAFLKSRASLRSIEILAMASTIFLLVNGSVLMLKARHLREYNDIYTEYGRMLLLCGAGFLIYELILIFMARKRNLSITNQN